MATPTLREWLEEKPFGLSMSSGFFGFFAHAGFATALYEANLRPARLSGSSAGALVASGLAAGMDPAAFERELRSIRRADFWDPFPGLGLLRGKKFRARLDALLPVTSFEDCALPLAVSVFDVFSRQTRVLDEGPLAVAVQASCTFPFLFQPVWMQRRPIIDGGVLDRPGLAGMPADQERVLYHHLNSRSWWRRKKSTALNVPKRDGMRSVVIDGLPRSGPTKLHIGPVAFEAALKRTRVALSRPASEVVLVGDDDN